MFFELKYYFNHKSSSLIPSSKYEYFTWYESFKT